MSKFSLALHMKAYLHHPYSITLIGIGSWLGLYVVFMVTDHVPSYESIHPLSIFNHTYWYWVLAWVICCFYGDWPCTVIWKQTFITHTPSGILVLGFGSGHMLFLWWLSMYRHMKPNIHTPYSITHIGIGSWLVSYVVFMGTDHVPTYESIPRSSILNHAYYIYILGLGLGHMLLLWWLTMYPHMKAYIHHPQSIMHIGIGSWFG